MEKHEIYFCLDDEEYIMFKEISKFMSKKIGHNVSAGNLFRGLLYNAFENLCPNDYNEKLLVCQKCENRYVCEIDSINYRGNS